MGKFDNDETELLAIQFAPIDSRVLDIRAETLFKLERLCPKRRPRYLFIRTFHRESLIVLNNLVDSLLGKERC